MGLLDKAKLMKGEEIRVRFTGCNNINENELIIGKVYSAIHNGVGHKGNAMFSNLIDEKGDRWCGQLDGRNGFRMLLKP
jgi:hypothetical protein